MATKSLTATTPGKSLRVKAKQQHHANAAGECHTSRPDYDAYEISRLRDYGAYIHKKPEQETAVFYINCQKPWANAK